MSMMLKDRADCNLILLLSMQVVGSLVSVQVSLSVGIELWPHPVPFVLRSIIPSEINGGPLNYYACMVLLLKIWYYHFMLSVHACVMEGHRK